MGITACIAARVPGLGRGLLLKLGDLMQNGSSRKETEPHGWQAIDRRHMAVVGGVVARKGRQQRQTAIAERSLSAAVDGKGTCKVIKNC